MTTRHNIETYNTIHQKLKNLLENPNRNPLYYRPAGWDRQELMEKAKIATYKTLRNHIRDFTKNCQVEEENRKLFWITHHERFEAWKELSNMFLSLFEQTYLWSKDFFEKNIIMFTPHMFKGKIAYSFSFRSKEQFREDLNKKAKEAWDASENAFVVAQTLPDLKPGEIGTWKSHKGGGFRRVT
jgi:hypothetical protein